MKIGLVVLNYNDYLTTSSFLKKNDFSLIEHVVVVDNASTDESYSYLKTFDSPKIHVVRNDSNRGYSAGNNFGCKYLLSCYAVDLIIIANPDVIFNNEILIAFTSFLDTHPDYALVTGMMLYPDGRLDRQPYLDFNSYVHDIANCFYIGRCFDKLFTSDKKLQKAKNKEILDVDAVPGCFYGLTKIAYEKIDGLDEGTFLFQEELILGKRLKRMGYKCALLSKYDYIHAHSASIKKNLNLVKKWRIYCDSVLYYQNKYNNINWVKRVFLKLCIKYSICEFKIIHRL